MIVNGKVSLIRNGTFSLCANARSLRLVGRYRAYGLQKIKDYRLLRFDSYLLTCGGYP